MVSDKKSIDSLSPIERAIALSSLMLALDRVDNTIGHFVSYLSKWSSRSYNNLVLQVPKIFVTDHENVVLKNDIFKICNTDVDLAYFDPPYGSNNDKMPPSRVRYASYYHLGTSKNCRPPHRKACWPTRNPYTTDFLMMRRQSSGRLWPIFRDAHLWTTICLNDTPQLFGKARRRADTSDKVSGSVFEEFRKNPNTGRFIAVEALENLIRSTAARWIILSYSSGGRGTAEEINQMLSECGRIVDVVKVDYRRNVMAEMKWTHEWLADAESPNFEFLFLIDKHELSR